MLRTFLVVAILLSTSVQAGSQDDPEVSDPGGDGGLGGKDVLATWIEDALVWDDEGAPSLVFGWEIASDGPDLSSLFAFHERIRTGFKLAYPGGPEGAEMYVLAQPNIGTTSQTGQDRFLCSFGIASAEGGDQDIAQQVSIPAGEWDGKVFHCLLPLELIGAEAAFGGTLADVWTVYQLVQRGPTSGGDAAGVRTVDLDRAPNADFGRDYTIEEAPSTGPGRVFVDIDGDAFAISNTTTAAANASFQYNWTAPADAALRITVNGTSGVVAINITAIGAGASGSNATLYACECNGTVEEEIGRVRAVCVDEAVVPVPCQYEIRIDTRGFAGTYGIASFIPAGDTDAPEPDAGDDNGTVQPANETLPDSGVDKDAPMPLAVLLTAFGFVAWLRRRMQ